MSGIYQLHFYQAQNGRWHVRFFGEPDRNQARPPAPARFDHRWFWNTVRPDRKGQACAVTARGRMNSVQVEFRDGERVITHRYAVRKARR